MAIGFSVALILLPMLESILNIVLPMRCAACKQLLSNAERGLCNKCLNGFEAVVEGHLLHFGMYQGKLEKAIRALKFAEARVVAKPLGRRLAVATRAVNWHSDAIIPVPLHGSRARQRGFNQAELLAQAMALELGVPMLLALQRTRATKQQARLEKSERLTNLEGAFAVQKSVVGLEVLLVDDVHTSGSTLTEASLCLIEAGAKRVRLVVLARA
jgi:ComF family protein